MFTYIGPPIPGEGTVFFEYRVTAEWGSLVSNGILVSDDGVSLRLPAPFRTTGSSVIGDGWTITLSPDWEIRAGERPGEFQVVRRTE